MIESRRSCSATRPPRGGSLHGLLTLAIAALTVTILGVHPGFAEDAGTSCASCVERKQRMCSSECSLVAPDRARSCQKRCLSGYCSHRCSADARELNAWVTPDCDTCLEQQFATCEEQCPVGTARNRAICQLGCADRQCVKECSAAALPKRGAKAPTAPPKRAGIGAGAKASEKAPSAKSPQAGSPDAGAPRSAPAGSE